LVIYGIHKPNMEKLPEPVSVHDHVHDPEMEYFLFQLWDLETRDVSDRDFSLWMRERGFKYQLKLEERRSFEGILDFSKNFDEVVLWYGSWEKNRKRWLKKRKMEAIRCHSIGSNESF
jgi:hypothetical protein